MKSFFDRLLEATVMAFVTVAGIAVALIVLKWSICSIADFATWLVSLGGAR